jgi:hypothetical protein
MKYALISDVHANLPALKAVQGHITERSDIDAIYHLGDLVGYAPWPNEVVALIASSGSPGWRATTTPLWLPTTSTVAVGTRTPPQEELSHLSYAWTRHHVSPDTKSLLASLPFRIDLLPNGGHQAGPRVVLVHGTPTLNTVYWTEDRPDDFCLKMAQRAASSS